MTNPDPIVIQRSELPEACSIGGYVSAGTQHNYYVSLPHATMAREKAYELLAIAEKIDEVIKEQADDKLREEANTICNKVVGLPFTSQSPAMNVEHWLKVARAAREVHGIK